MSGRPEAALPPPMPPTPQPVGRGQGAHGAVPNDAHNTIPESPGVRAPLQMGTDMTRGANVSAINGTVDLCSYREQITFKESRPLSSGLQLDDFYTYLGLSFTVPAPYVLLLHLSPGVLARKNDSVRQGGPYRLSLSLSLSFILLRTALKDRP